MNVERQISFTDSEGTALFSIPDNGVLCLFYGNGDTHFSLCRFLDQNHVEIDGVKYAVQEFARRMERNKIIFAPA